MLQVEQGGQSGVILARASRRSTCCTWFMSVVLRDRAVSNIPESARLSQEMSYTMGSFHSYTIGHSPLVSGR
jgi:hypothetical protein